MYTITLLGVMESARLYLSALPGYCGKYGNSRIYCIEGVTIQIYVVNNIAECKYKSDGFIATYLKNDKYGYADAVRVAERYEKCIIVEISRDVACSKRIRCEQFQHFTSETIEDVLFSMRELISKMSQL